MQQTVAIVGAGSWGTALAVQLAKKGHIVKIWARDDRVVNDINNLRENRSYLPGVTMPENVKCSADIVAVLANCQVVLYGVPSHAFRDMLKITLPFVPKNIPLVNLAKGIAAVKDQKEPNFKRMQEVFTEEVAAGEQHRYVVLSGPSHAEEVGRDIPTALVVASPDIKRAEYVQNLFMSANLRVYTNPDVVGVELGGALKNIIALSAGIAEGLGFGDNTKAALMTRGLAEIIRLGMAMGAAPLTFAGLTGVGDLIVTCSSMYSRNRRAGIAIGKGQTVAEAVKSVRMVVEGVRTTKAARWLAARYQVEMPITEQTYQVLFNNFSPRQAVMNLMGRSSKPEMEEVALLKWSR